MKCVSQFGICTKGKYKTPVSNGVMALLLSSTTKFRKLLKFYTAVHKCQIINRQLF
jgi:hypothetical protein